MHFVTSYTFVTGSQPRLHIKALPAIKKKPHPTSDQSNQNLQGPQYF